MSHKNIVNTALGSVEAATDSAIQHITANVIGTLIAEQLIDPITDDVPYFWETVEKAVDRAIDGLDLIGFPRVLKACQDAYLARQEARRAVAQTAGSSTTDTDAL